MGSPRQQHPLIDLFACLFVRRLQTSTVTPHLIPMRGIVMATTSVQTKVEEEEEEVSVPVPVLVFQKV